MTTFDWQWSEFSLNLKAEKDRPAMVVYWLSNKRWCWNTYPDLDKRLPMPEKRQRFSTAQDAQDSAERWLRAHFAAPVPPDQRGEDGNG